MLPTRARVSLSLRGCRSFPRVPGAPPSLGCRVWREIVKERKGEGRRERERGAPPDSIRLGLIGFGSIGFGDWGFGPGSGSGVSRLRDLQAGRSFLLHARAQ